jgi:hypothetical protein
MTTKSLTSVAVLSLTFAASAFVYAQSPPTSTWHDVYEPNTSNNNFKFNNAPPAVNTALWQNGNQHIDLNVSTVSVHELAGGFGGKIYAHVVPWFNGSAHLSPGYFSASTAEVDAQIDAMLARGIDGVIVDWYGPNRYEDTATQVWRDRILARGLGSGFVLAIMIDKGALSGCGSDCTTRLNFLIHDTIVPEYENTLGDAYMRDASGRPILYFFDVQQDYPSIDWGSVRYWASTASGVEDHVFFYEGAGGLDPSQVPETEADGGFAWIDVRTTAAGYLGWYYKQNTHGRISVGSAYKGFDDSAVHCWGQTPCPRLVAQRCGLNWLESFDALRQAPTPVDAVQLVTWNDYEEGTALEIGIDNCLASIDLQRSGNTAVWHPVWNSGGSASTIHHYTVWARVQGSQTMYDCSGDLDPSQSTFNLDTCPLPSGTYQIYVQAVGQPLVKNLLSPVPSSFVYQR